MNVKSLYDDKALFESISVGDTHAFSMLFERYKNKLYRFIDHIVKSKECAEEIVHDIFLTIWQNQHKLQHVDNPGSYLFAMARNRAMDHLRKVARERSLLDKLWNTITESFSSQDALETGETYKLVTEAINRLSPQRKLIYQLSREEGLNHQQIAEKLNISKSTVNNHLVESLRQIKSFLQKHNLETLLVLLLLRGRF